MFLHAVLNVIIVKLWVRRTRKKE